MDMTNDHELYIWALNMLLLAVVALIGIVVRMHQKTDEDYRIRTDKELEELTRKVEELQNKKVGRLLS